MSSAEPHEAAGRSLRGAIEDELDRRGWSIHRLVSESGLGRATVYEFLKGQREIQTDSLERLCDALDLELRPRRKE